MKKKWIALLLTALLCFSGCTAKPGTEETNVLPAETMEAQEPSAEPEQSPEAVQLYTAEDMQDVDSSNPNLKFSEVDFSKQPAFQSKEGLDEYFRDCVEKRCRSIVFTCDRKLSLNLNSNRFCEDYLTVWSNVKMEPGDCGKHYIIRVTYYPGDNVAWAYNNHDTSSLEKKEPELYDAAVQWILENISDAMSDYEKCVAIHNYLSGTVRYSNQLLEELNSSFTFDWGITAYGAMIDHESICQGYADAFRMLTTMLGMDCIQIYGTGSGEPHNWNMIRLDGKWYHVDCTQDDKFGDDGTSAKVYLFASDGQMRKTHSWDESRYPKADDDTLWYYRANNAILEREEELETMLAAPLKEGKQVDLYVKNLPKKQVCDYIQALGGQFHAAVYGTDFLLCAWL